MVLNATIMHLKNIHSLKHKMSLSIWQENHLKKYEKVTNHLNQPKMASNGGFNNLIWPQMASIA